MSTCFPNNLQPAIKWLAREARNTCLSETAAVILMRGDLFQPGVLLFAESKERQTKDTSAWHFQWCQSQEGLSELLVYTRDGAITLNSQQAHIAALQQECTNPRTFSTASRRSKHTIHKIKMLFFQSKLAFMVGNLLRLMTVI